MSSNRLLFLKCKVNINNFLFTIIIKSVKSRHVNEDKVTKVKIVERKLVFNSYI